MKSRISYEPQLIIVICLLAALRVFLYSAAFPFFSNIDEQAHFDLVMKYSKGYIPKSIENMSIESAYYIPRYESPEYFNAPENQPNGIFQSPPWTKPESAMQRYYSEGTVYWSNNYLNHELSQAPLYYVIAGSWTNLGKLLGIGGGYMLYWIRFLNILFMVALVVIARKTAIELFPEDPFFRIGIPLLVAFIPQDSYYCIQNDVLSPVAFGVTFLLLIKYINTEFKSNILAFGAGLSLSLTMLVKVSNLPLFPICITSSLLLFIRTQRINRTHYITLMLFISSALIPVTIWFLRNYFVFGDLTGSEEKIKILGWTHRNISEWFQHPIFTFTGITEFTTGIISTFWRGEMIWWTKPIADSISDMFFILSTLIFIIAGIFINKNNNKLFSQSNKIAIASFISVILFMILLSISFDFGNCENPSRMHPYFVSGRLISGVLIPFGILYLQGMNTILFKIRDQKIKLYILASAVVIITALEYINHIPVFESKFNFFNL